MEMMNISSLFATVKDPTALSVVYSLCLSFLLSSLIAMTYQKTFQGLSYSRNYVQALVLAALVTTIAMQAIGDSLARGLGMMGALAIVRFRSSLKDPKDMIFIFAALSVGIASGVYSFTIAAVGATGFCLIAYVLHALPFSRSAHFDGLVKFNLRNDSADKEKIQVLMKDHCQLFALVTLRDLAQGERIDYAYQVRLRRGVSNIQFLEQLQGLDSIKGLNFFLQESTVEV